jgi:uncharacterized protein (TIGR02145 family)
MNTAIKTGLAALLLVAISCKKENNTIQPDKISQDHMVEANDPGVQAYIGIGTQKWTTTNLNVSHYRNGDIIPQVKDSAQWAKLTTGAWCWYNNDSATGAAYGKLYNWYAVNDPRGLAPTGWHVPSDAEWDTLNTRLGNNAGGKLKDTGTVEAGTGLWHVPNKGATNRTGFTGLPGASRYGTGGFYSIGYYGYWWSSTEASTVFAWFRYLLNTNGRIGGNYDTKRDGLSVRCIKD